MKWMETMTTTATVCTFPLLNPNELRTLNDDDEEVESRIELENDLDLNEDKNQYSEKNLNKELASFSAPFYTNQLPMSRRDPLRKGDTILYEECNAPEKVKLNPAKVLNMKPNPKSVQNSHPKYLSFLRRNGNNILWIFKCRLCPFETLHLERIETHVQIHEEGSGAIACGKCGWFLLPQWMEAHSNVNHPPPPESRPSTMVIAIEKKIPTIYKSI
ncbi:unnamed protein product [Orchesella dallaii]|uniref:C2H2-type domain-containing protein n=1 Tax=Orchesella dallaii TaxID=48710 RepID=A0ABP1RUM9_9HEXA